jgi:hypothetical protein
LDFGILPDGGENPRNCRRHDQPVPGDTILVDIYSAILKAIYQGQILLECAHDGVNHGQALLSHRRDVASYSAE